MRRILPIIAALVSVLAIAACGSSSTSATTAGSGNAQVVKFAECMRAHGVPRFPDPSAGGGGTQISGISPFSPAFKAAQATCAKLVPGGAPGGGTSATAAEKATALHLSQCMRANGVSGFPDPVSSPPSAPGFSLAFGHRGAFIVVPGTIDVNSPAFQRAAKACHFPGA